MIRQTTRKFKLLCRNLKFRGVLQSSSHPGPYEMVQRLIPSTLVILIQSETIQREH
jgi:hypothetical protein